MINQNFELHIREKNQTEYFDISQPMNILVVI